MHRADMPDHHRPLETVLVASDLQATSASVTEVAGSIARGSGGAGVVLFHVVERKEDEEGDMEELYQRTEADARRALELQAETLRESGVRVEEIRTVRHHSPHRAILEELEGRGGDLLVVGTHSRRSTPHRLGSTADRLLRTSPVPCLVVRGTRGEAPAFRRAAVLSDGSPVSREALRVAFDWLPPLGAGTPKSPLELLRVGDPEVRALDPGHPAFLEELLETEIRSARERAEAAGRGEPAAADARVLWGRHVVDRILEEAESEGYDLLVAGTHGRGAVVRWLVGSVALGLAQAAPCPVLVVPPPDRRSLEAVEEPGEPGARGDASPIARIMRAPVVTVPLGTSLADAASAMLEGDIGSVLCVDGEGRIRGVVTDSDFAARSVGIPFSTFRAPQLLGRWLDEGGVERIYREARKRAVDEIMSEPVYSVDEGATIEEVLDLMLKRDVKHVPVVRDDRPVGMVARHDLLKFLLGRLPG